MEELKKENEKAKEKDNIVKKNGGLLSKFFKLEPKKKIQYVAILLVIIVILAIYYGSSASSSKGAAEVQAKVTTIEEDNIETRLKQTLSSIEGAGMVEVMITYESSSEIVPAISVDTQTSTTTDTDETGNSTTNTENTQSEIVTVNGSNGSAALVLREDSPQVKGVLVIAEGADDIGVKINLLNAVQTILNVSPDRVNVYKMNNE